MSSSKPIHPGVRIGHVHLKVADLERALKFYRDVLGFELTQRYGVQYDRRALTARVDKLIASFDVGSMRELQSHGSATVELHPRVGLSAVAARRG